MRCVNMMWRFNWVFLFLCAWPFCGGAQTDLFRFEGITWKEYLPKITTTSTINAWYGVDAKYAQEYKIAKLWKKIKVMSINGDDGKMEAEEWQYILFDRSGRVVVVKEFAQDTTKPTTISTFAYDRFGNLIDYVRTSYLLMEMKWHEHYEYNNIGKVKRVQNFYNNQKEAENTREYLYNAKQELVIERISPDSYTRTVTYEYDGMGRLVKRHHLDKDNTIIRTDSIAFIEVDVLIDSRKVQQAIYYERAKTTDSFFRRTEEFVDEETGLSLQQVDSITYASSANGEHNYLENYKRFFDPQKEQYEYSISRDGSYYVDIKHKHVSGLVDRGETMSFVVSDKGEKKPTERFELLSKTDAANRLVERTRTFFVFQHKLTGTIAQKQSIRIETFYWSFYP
jgi:YD repeat-containing protein